uniref:Uncharacterized protein n=1 Tax=Anguilla anguilla TaxID=7936 RepID=A0A0E9SXF9_ANGAN
MNTNSFLFLNKRGEKPVDALQAPTLRRITSSFVRARETFYYYHNI